MYKIYIIEYCNWMSWLCLPTAYVKIEYNIIYIYIYCNLMNYNEYNDINTKMADL